MTTQHNLRISTEDPSVLEELIRSAQAAEEPGDKQGTIYQGDLPMAVDMVKSAGYVRMWVAKTGEERYTNRNMIPHQLTKRDERGDPVFTFRDPGIRPKSPSLLCYLHANHPRRGEFDSMGFPVCTKDGRFSTEFDVLQHMRGRHRVEFRMMEAEEERIRREEDRALQRATLEAMSGRSSPIPQAPTSPAPTAISAPPQNPPQPPATPRKRQMSEEQKQAARERLARARAIKAAKKGG